MSRVSVAPMAAPKVRVWLLPNPPRALAMSRSTDQIGSMYSTPSPVTRKCVTDCVLWTITTSFSETGATGQ